MTDVASLAKVFRYARGMSVEHWMYSDRFGRDEACSLSARPLVRTVERYLAGRCGWWQRTH